MLEKIKIKIKINIKLTDTNYLYRSTNNIIEKPILIIFYYNFENGFHYVGTQILQSMLT